MKKMKKVWLTCLCCLCAGWLFAQQPRVYSSERLAKIKAEPATHSKAVRSLLSQADKELKSTPPSVMEKTMIPASGDKHDYMSMGPYWWPDPDKEDGLPYIRKDGERNPELDKLDRNKLGRMARAVITLGLGYYFSGNEKYADKAVDFLKVWFMDPDTRMNPNLIYRQTIPGRNNGLGRGEGVIDTYSFVEMLDAVELLKSSKAWTPEVEAGMQSWFTAFVEWLTTHPVAIQEKQARNNHGLAYDVQVARYALFTGNEELARSLVAGFPETRLFKQIEPDGKQPLELARTTALGYTVFNLTHMLDMASIARSLGMDIYHVTSEDGRSVTAAIGFLIPYLGKPQSAFPYQQIKEWDEKQNEGCWVLRRAAKYDPAAGYSQIAATYDKTSPSSRSWLLYDID